MSARLTTEVVQRWEEVWCLEARVTQQHSEVQKLWADMDGKPLDSFVVFLPRAHG